MLRLCSRRVGSLVKLCATVPLQSAKVPGVRVYDSTRHLSSVSSPGAANPPEYPCSDPDLLPDNWSEVEDWSMIWYDGRDTVHVRVNATEEDTDWRGVGFYSREAYWLGALRWNERMRGEEPAVWLHWVGKDPVEICNKLPHPDENGCYTFSISFHKRELVLHCNGEFMGVRKNMIYQFKNVGRLWFADLERVNGSYVIEGPHTDDSGYTTYQDVPIFQKVSDMYRVFKQCQKDHAEGNLPDHGWRNSS